MGTTIGNIANEITTPKAADWYENEQDAATGKISWENKMKGTGNAWALLEEAATATNPNMCPTYGDTDTGVGSAGADQLSIIAGGKEIARAVENVAEQFIINPQADLSGTASAPSLAFGDGDTGFYEPSDDSLNLVLAGGVEFRFTTTYFDLFRNGGPRMLDEDASGVNPTLAPYGTDSDTGIGRAAADQLSLIAGGIEGLRIEEGNNGTVGSHLFIPDLTTAPTGNPTGGGYLYTELGALKYRGSSGTITTIANA